MHTEVIKVDRSESPARVVRRAVRALVAGGLVVFPTETVYGVAARADHPGAMQRLRQLKGRSCATPFTLHVPASADANQYVSNESGLARRGVGTL